jgi:hypothetical protein
VAVDGSSISDRAVVVASNLVQPKRGDKLSVLHISDSKKDYLPRHLQPSHLKNYYQGGVPRDRSTGNAHTATS